MTNTNQEFKESFEHSPLGIIVLDRQKNQDIKICYLNKKDQNKRYWIINQRSSS